MKHSLSSAKTPSKVISSCSCWLRRFPLCLVLTAAVTWGTATTNREKKQEPCPPPHLSPPPSRPPPTAVNSFLLSVHISLSFDFTFSSSLFLLPTTMVAHEQGETALWKWVLIDNDESGEVLNFKWWAATFIGTSFESFWYAHARAPSVLAAAFHWALNWS